jgi:hypothetical protein
LQDAGLLTAPQVDPLVTRERDRERAHIGLGDIGDVDEIARLFARSIDDERLVIQQAVEKDRDDARVWALGILPRPEDVEVAERDRR